MIPEEFRALVANYLAAIRANRAVPRVLAEASLYEPLDRLLNGFLLLDGRERIRAVQQARTEFGIPDFVVDAGGPIGYVEAKRPAADLDDLPARDAKQLEGFLNLPNLILTNFREFRLYEEGRLVEEVDLGGLDLLDHRRATDSRPGSVDSLWSLLRRFASHRIAPARSVGELADALARAARVLHDAALATVKAAPDGALASLHKEWQQVLFHEADDREFADAYAQTLTYGLLTARLDNPKEALTIDSALRTLHGRHPFLGAALRLLTDPMALEEVGWAVDLVVQTLDGVSADIFRRGPHAEDPLLYFYEDFLARYDAGMRKRRGVYFTPASVVRFQVGAVADLLRGLGRDRVLAEDDVVALDPAAGTGTYLLGLLDETVAKVRELDGEGAVPARAAQAAGNLNGFEILVGPYTVAHQRMAGRLAALGAATAPIRVFLVDTLAEPETGSEGQLQLPFERQLSQERRRADAVKRDDQVMIVMANPPYERAKGRSAGDWLQRKMTLFSGPVSQAARVNLKNLADAYMYFFRWALWKLFESPPAAGPRILTFISNRSYLGADWAEGMRLALRQRFDDIWIVDLEGETRGPMATENIFDQIRVGVAIIVGAREDAASEKSDEARVRYTRITGTREEKERGLKAALADLEWQEVDRSRGEALLPRESPGWRRWVSLAELMPFRQSGVETKRDALVVGVTPQRLRAQLEPLDREDIPADEKGRIFHETRDRKLPPSPGPIDSRRFRRYGYRPFDVRWLYDDLAFVDFPRPKLHKYWFPGQRAFCTLPKGHGPGPAVVFQTELPDRHAYRGSFGGHVFPLWLDPDRRDPNLAQDFLRLVSSHVDEAIEAQDVFAYAFAVLHAPSYHRRFALDLAQGFPRVPFPTEGELLTRGSQLGRSLLAAHEMNATGRARLVGEPGPLLESPVWQEGRLRVCPGGFVEPVSQSAWEFSVSGYRVIENWLTKGRTGLNLATDWDLVDQLLRVVEAVEQTVRLGPKLDALLDAVLAGETLGRRALLPFDLRAAAEEFSRAPGALDEAAREADEWSEVSEQAVLEAES